MKTVILPVDNLHFDLNNTEIQVRNYLDNASAIKDGANYRTGSWHLLRCHLARYGDNHCATCSTQTTKITTEFTCHS